MRAREPFPYTIEAITIADGRRPVDWAAVDRIADSIARIGLQTPITCRYVDETEAHDDQVILVAGRHRLEACRKLGWTHIPVVMWDDATPEQARMWEIAENLHRADLSVLERDEQVAEWVRLADRFSAQSAPKMERGRPEGGANAAARELGIERTSVQRAVKVASLTDEAKAEARALGLDNNRSALLRAASSSDPVAALHEIKAVKIADRPLNDAESLERQVAALMSAWNKASAQAREEFLGRIEVPVFDRGSACAG